MSALPNFDNSASGESESAKLDDLISRFRPVFARIAEGAAQREHQRELAYEAIEWLRESGFTSVRLPIAHGGQGASVEQLFALLVELAEADSNLTQALRPHFGFVERILIHGNDDTRKRWLPRIAQGKIFGNASTETGNSPLGVWQTTLTPDATQPGHWRLNGEKFYSTGSLYADWVSVVARAVVPGRDDETVHAVVPATTEGLERIDDWSGFGQRLTASGSTKLRNASVPEDSLLRFRSGEPSPTVAYFQLFHLATLAGIARAIERDTVAYLKSRKRTFSHGAASLAKDDPLVQQIVGQLASTNYIAGLAVADVAREVGKALRETAAHGKADKSLLDALELRTAKAQIAVVELVLQAANRMFDVGGATAVGESLRLDRHWRNARTLAQHNPAIYKALSVGDILLNDAAPIYYWHTGIAA